MSRSLIAQISEVSTEINKRKDDYGRLVESGKMRKGEADYKIETMEAVLNTLHFLLNNETTIREAIAARRAAQEKQNA